MISCIFTVDKKNIMNLFWPWQGFKSFTEQANKQTKLNYRKCNCENFWQAREGSGREKRWQLFSFEITLFKIFLSILPTFFCKANMLWHQVFKSYYSVLPKNYAKLYNSPQLECMPNFYIMRSGQYAKKQHTI